MNFISQIAEIKNLYWAWEKAKAFYKPGDIWFDELQVSEFEANLHAELLSIQKDILRSNYILQPIRPVAFPKSNDKEEGPRTRQTFWISVRDQVTWLAVANILGRELDSEMPFWSYGNRLYISTFYDNNVETGKPELKFGYYRNSTKHTYRKWSQSWPLYRRHITLTAKYLAKGGKSTDLPEDVLEEKEPEMLKVNDSLNDDHPLKVKYIKADYWNRELNGELYWAGLDLKNFYPQLNLEVVKENIKTYIADKPLNIFLESLFSFKIEFDGWGDEECNKIKLERTELYTHMPTGLFVAGFLSNVAMLKVDKEVTAKLNKQRNIAHFRYVDDHVILATSFDDIVTWITEYQKIIENNNIGAEFNAEKTQPKELADYLKAIKNNNTSQDDLEASKENAKEATKLDPAFPSPLMTQTLAKVSKIAGTEFQLLDPDEERSLIADIEHLLVTEFPDQELRRDTRVSFAARMLSSLVPQITINTEKAYNLESALIQLETEQDKYEKKGGKNEDIAKKIDATKAALSRERSSIERQESLLVSRTLKLLLKAIRDNHDKVRLWTRVIEFALKTGKIKILDVLNEINLLKKKSEINDLSAGFINALLLQVLSQLLFKAINNVQSERISNRQKRRSLSFIRNAITENVLNYFEEATINTTKFYEQDSLLLFKYTCGTILYLINDDSEKESDTYLIEKYFLIDWVNSPAVFFEKSSYSLAIWAWWTFNRVSLNNNQKAVLELWEKIRNNLDLSLPIDRNLILLFPRYLSQKLLNQIEQHKNYFLENEGWLFEVKIGLVENHVDNNSLSFLSNVNSKTAIEFEKNVTLYDWIIWTKERDNKLRVENKDKLVFDPRLSEWMALEIVKRVAVLIDDKITNIGIEALFEEQPDYSICLHPNNFKLPKKWIEENNDDLTWEKLRQMVDHEHHYITMRAKDDLIYDRRFDFTQKVNADLYADNHENNKAINAMGSLLTCLLTKKFNLPYRWNPIGHQQVWLSMAKAELRNIALSSYTRDIIDGCFSNRNIETVILLQLQAKKGMSLVNDTTFDPPSIVNLKIFIQYIQLAQEELEKQQLSVSNHQPRQLIPVSLKQMKRNNYQDQIENPHDDIQ